MTFYRFLAIYIARRLRPKNCCFKAFVNYKTSDQVLFLALSLNNDRPVVLSGKQKRFLEIEIRVKMISQVILCMALLVEKSFLENCRFTGHFLESVTD